MVHSFNNKFYIMKKNIFYWVGYGYTVLTIVAFLAFTSLKWFGVIVWSWWWITSPLWGSFVAALVFVGILYLMFVRYTNKNEK